MTRISWERATEIPLLIAGFLFLFSYSWQVLANPSPEVYFAWEVVAIAVWVFFGVDYIVRLVLAKQRARWFVRNIVDFIVLVMPALRPLRLVRLLFLVRVFRRNAPRLVRNRILAFASISTVLLVYIASLAVLEACISPGRSWPSRCGCSLALTTSSGWCWPNSALGGLSATSSTSSFW